ncbi:MAG: tRNA (adenosine(37)-N6)-threonylcarbamoyltransferase complex transferase subunit TsaD [Candidatus Paceibacterota bacterium]|jgi:N6-L-threonylcarbamoyladenine synthase
MRILSIETSCDETAISIVEAEGGLESPSFKVLGNVLFSQIDIHKEYGGVYPMLAKREHAKNLPPLLKKVLTEASMFTVCDVSYSKEKWNEVEKILNREEGLYEELKSTLENVKKPDIDVISVTSGPGLAPALWVGVSCAKALGILWDIQVIPINHMEGHIASVLLNKTEAVESKIRFPALALLVSGGHTQLVNMLDWGKYEILGETLDDAVGEAFDKTARMLGLPYPGGPEISRLAERARTENLPHLAKFPRPMIHSDNLNFSFSGLKTSVLYYLRDYFSDTNSPSENEKADMAREFEDAVVDVLKSKTKKALDQTGAKTLIIAGGVIANKKIRSAFMDFEKEYSELIIRIPTNIMATDNSLMIACATYINIVLRPNVLTNIETIVADGNLRLK